MNWIKKLRRSFRKKKKEPVKRPGTSKFESFYSKALAMIAEGEPVLYKYEPLSSGLTCHEGKLFANPVTPTQEVTENHTMYFPETFKEFADSYSIKDTDEVYSNGADFIPVFRVEQWLEHTMAIKALEHEPKWIPVSERLPDKLNDVLITFYDCPNEYDVAYLRTTFNESYKKSGAKNEWVSSMGETTYADYEVDAWMPIYPYKLESEE